MENRFNYFLILILGWSFIYFLPHIKILEIFAWIYYIFVFFLLSIANLLIFYQDQNFINNLKEIESKKSIKKPLWFNSLYYYPIITYLAYNGFLYLSIFIFIVFYLNDILFTNKNLKNEETSI
jgi:hypothetical protein